MLSTVPCTVYDVACTIATPMSGYLILLDATSAPGSGDVTGGASGAYLACVPFTTTSNNQTVNMNENVGGGMVSQSGIRCAVGAVVLLSSTSPTSVTPVASSLWCNGGLG